MKRILQYILHWVVNRIILFREDIEFQMNDLDQELGPFFFIGNHVTNWDPFFINVPIKEPISFVCSDRFFKIWPLGPLLRLVDAVPKTKNKSDMGTIRKLLARKNDGKHIGVFPEGRRSWDGTTEPLYYATAKLIKLLKMPVVAVEIHGGNLAYPRWARRRRKGKIKLTYRYILTVEQIEMYSMDELFGTMRSALLHQEEIVQSQENYHYKGPKRAEHLEKLFFACPSCQKFDTLTSKQHSLYCDHCGYQVYYNDQTLLLDTRGIKAIYGTVSQWNHWQKEYLANHIEECLSQGIFEKSVLVKTFNKERKLLRKEKSKIVLTSGGIMLETDYFPIHTISGENVQSNDILEFYVDEDTLKQIRFLGRIESSYKWIQAISLIKKGI